ncbi:putative response regulator and transcription factor RR-A-type family [Rosa chinensis]|uniref:Putative response regulator and transcription factor RR-A-type family n=1 Tax=Rosa chinensis TaxID=74649 RepID=A0A2P6PKJ1_ROSCH|nr:two-component response regulator ORR3 [Rosa chinensis]PRQ22445.1 putative response regulator and transcription factor RR-A-type family [Rosa chinensis]
MAELSPEVLVHVLVVDDCLVDRKIVDKLLKASAFKVTTVESGKKALEVLGMEEEKLDKPSVKDHDVNIILTDYCMPEMNGHDLLVAVKEDSRMKSIPVVIMSSEFNPQRISRCLTDGAQEFLQKPLKVKDLEKLRSYVKPAVPVPKVGTKRKALVDLMPESNEAERRPCPAGVAVA